MEKRRSVLIVISTMLALTGCTSTGEAPSLGASQSLPGLINPSETPGTTTFTVVPGQPAPPDENGNLSLLFGAAARWAVESGVMEITTLGSGSCPNIASGTRTDPDGVTTVLLQTTGGPTCSLDLVQHTSTIEMPDGADNGLPITIRIGDGEGATELSVQPRAAAGQAGPVSPEGSMETVSVPDPEGPLIRPLP